MATATASKTEEMLVDWLRDAHAMEKHAEQVLSSTASTNEQLLADVRLSLPCFDQDTAVG
jgi:ferritin-like metal-binding protein YciE